MEGFNRFARLHQVPVMHALVMPTGFHGSVWDLGNGRGPLAPELVEGHLEEVGRCHVLQPCPVGPLGADGAVLVGPDSVLEVAAEGEALTWPGWGRLKLCLHLGLLLSWLDLLLLLLLLLFWAADLLGRNPHLLLLHPCVRAMVHFFHSARKFSKI